MGKILEGLFEEGRPTKKEIRTHLQKKYGKTLCYVLITCTEPNEDGNMEVEMKYEGDKWVAAYLISSAQGILEEEENGSI